MIKRLEFDDSPELVSLHFNVPEHHIPLKDFTDTAKRVEGIIEGFNKTLFDGKLKYELVVIPPKPGTFWEILGYTLSASGGVLGMVFAYTQTQDGRVFCKALTGHEPAYWHEKAGIKLRGLIRKIGGDEASVTDEMVLKRTEEMLLAETTKAFLKTPEDNLIKAGISTRKFRSAYDERNKFYATCLRNKELKGLGFEDGDDFPIRRHDFSGLQVKLPPEDDIDEQLDWVVGVERLVVPSPTWERKIQEDVKWFAHYGDKKDARFIIEDEGFWRLKEEERLVLRPTDNLKVQWAYIEKRGKRQSYRVLRVLEYNEVYLADQLSDDALDALLGRYNKEDDSQTDFFERD